MKRILFIMFLLFTTNADTLWIDGFENYTNLSQNYQDVSTNGFSITSEDPNQGLNSICQYYEEG